MEPDNDAAKIFVGGLDWETTVDDMREYFTNFGTVVDCSIKADHNTGMPRGFGFVTFADPSSVDMVLNERNHVLRGKVIDPKRVKFKTALESLQKIFVGGLDPQMSESAIREYFSKYGVIDEIDLPYDRTTNERRRFCFIRFTSNEPVERLCAVPKHTIGGKMVEVKRALNKSELAAQSGASAPSSFNNFFHGPFASSFSSSGQSRAHGSYSSLDSHWPVTSSFGLSSSGNGFGGSMFGEGSYFDGRSSTGYGYGDGVGAAGYGVQSTDMRYSIPSYAGGHPARGRGGFGTVSMAALPRGFPPMRGVSGRGRATTANLRYQPYNI